MFGWAIAWTVALLQMSCCGDVVQVALVHVAATHVAATHVAATHTAAAGTTTTWPCTDLGKISTAAGRVREACVATSRHVCAVENGVRIRTKQRHPGRGAASAAPWRGRRAKRSCSLHEDHGQHESRAVFSSIQLGGEGREKKKEEEKEGKKKKKKKKKGDVK